MKNVRERRECGKLALDLLIGLSIFLFTFIFIANFLPGVFADVRKEITLSHETYKATVFLAETKGFWKNSTKSGSDWENYPNICGDNTFGFLPGLSEGEPDFLSLEKLKKFHIVCNQCTEKCRRMLGLDVNNVRFHVSLESLTSKPYKRTLVKYLGEPLLAAGDPLPSGGNIVRFERYVWLKPDPGLTGVYFVHALTGGAVPSHGWQCERKHNANYCSLNRTYPFTNFSLKLLEVAQSPTISICVDRSPIQGTCPLKTDIHLFVGDKNKEANKTTINKNALPIYLDFLDLVNAELRKMNVSVGDTVYVEIALRDVYVIFNIRDSFMADYMVGKAVAKLVVYGW